MRGREQAVNSGNVLRALGTLVYAELWNFKRAFSTDDITYYTFTQIHLPVVYVIIERKRAEGKRELQEIKGLFFTVRTCAKLTYYKKNVAIPVEKLLIKPGIYSVTF